MGSGPRCEQSGTGAGRVIICVVNRKGGVSKTSVCFQGSGSLAAKGKRVLLCDLDSQSSLSQGIFGPKWVEALPKSRTIAALFDPQYDPLPEQLIYTTHIPNVSLIPSNDHLTSHNLPLPAPGGEALGQFLREVRSNYDIILLDCPPNLQLCSWAALLASDFVVVVVVPEEYSSQGLIRVQAAISAAQAGGNPGLRHLGYLLTMHNHRLGVQRAYTQVLRQEYGPMVFSNTMPLATAYKEAIARRVPVSISAPKSVAAVAMDLIVEEILARANGTVDNVEPVLPPRQPDSPDLVN